MYQEGCQSCRHDCDTEPLQKTADHETEKNTPEEEESSAPALKEDHNTSRQGETGGDNTAGCKSDGHCSEPSSNAPRRLSPRESQAIRKFLKRESRGDGSKGNKKTGATEAKGNGFYIAV